MGQLAEGPRHASLDSLERPDNALWLHVAMVWQERHKAEYIRRRERLPDQPEEMAKSTMTYRFTYYSH